MAEAAYATLAAEYDGLAQKFTTAASVVDPETPAAPMGVAADKTGKAWSDAERYALQISSALSSLQAAASLAGAAVTSPGMLVVPQVSEPTMNLCVPQSSAAHGSTGITERHT